MSELEPPSPRCCGISPLVKQPAMNSTGSTGRHSPAHSWLREMACFQMGVQSGDTETRLARVESGSSSRQADRRRAS